MGWTPQFILLYYEVSSKKCLLGVILSKHLVVGLIVSNSHGQDAGARRGSHDPS